MKSFSEFASESDSESSDRFDNFADGALKKEPNEASIEAGKSIPPDQAAEAIKISTWTGVDPSLAFKKAQAFQQNMRKDNSDFEVLAKTAPITSDWGSADPFRASVAIDDMRNLAQVENVVKDDGLIRSLGKTLYRRGIGSLAKTVGQGPAVAYSLYSLPYNILAKATGGQQAKTPDGYIDNDVTRYWEDFAKKASPAELEDSITNEFLNGDISRAGRIAAFKVAANLPQQAVFLGSALAGAPALGLTFAGISQGAGALEEGAASGADPYNQTINAITQGAVEVWTEEFGTFGLAERLAKKFGKEAVKKGFLETVKTIAKDVFMTGVSEGNEEVWAQAMQEASARVTGVDKSDFNWGTFLKELGDSFVVGAASAFATTAPAGISTGIGNRIIERKTQQVRDFYTALGDSIEATETRKRLPQATREHVEALTKGSPVQDILIPIDAFETYFQGEKIDPGKFAKSVGSLDSYETAKSVGGYVKIPTSVWAEKVVGTPHYGNLANDVKFNPGDMTVNELKAFSEEMDKAAAERRPEMEQSGRVFDDFKSKLISNGFTGQEADAHSLLVAERYRRRAQIVGEDAFSLYSKDNIQITRPGEAPAQEQKAKITFEQSELNADFDKAFTPNDALGKGDKELESQAVGYAKEFSTEILADYAAKNGNVVSTDNFRRYFEPIGFNGLNTPVFHEPASALRRVYQRKVEEEAIISGKRNVVLMAGGSGSGKSSTIDFMDESVKKDAGLILDSNLSDIGKARKEIASFKKKGLNPTVLYIYRDPVDSWINGVMKRFISGEDVRTVPLSEHLKLHRGSYETALALAKEDKGNVFLIDNSRGIGNQKVVSVAELEGKVYNEGEIRKEIINETVKLFEEGKIDAAAVESAIGKTSKDEARLIPESVRRGSPQSDQTSQVGRKASKAVPDFRTFQQSQIEQRAQSRVLFEIAPDPNNLDLATRWRSVPSSDRSQISQEIASKIIPQILDSYGVKGDIQSQIGGYLDDTNPSLSLVLPAGTPPQSVVGITKLSGFALSQDGMMTVSEAGLPGAEEKSVIKIELPGGADFNAIRDIYASLREIEINGERPISGHTTANGVMSILNYSSLSREDLAEAIDKKLNGAYTITTDIVDVLWVPKEEYGYAGDTSSEGNAAGRQSSVQGDPNNLRGEASRLLSESLDRYEQARGTERQNTLRQNEIGQGGKNPRAQVRFGLISINIDLFKDADLSSLAHELSHVFTRSMGQDYDIVKTKEQSTLTNDQLQFIQDSESLLKWAGAESFESLTTDQHEKIARGWEAYLREGKAPSQSLRGAFSRFREWLAMVYRSVRQLDVRLNQDVRQVFDRMLASQEEIDAARDELNVSPLFSDAKSVGMTDSEAERYTADLMSARASAEEELAGKLIDETKREGTKIYQERKAQVTAEISSEVDSRKEYVALYALQRGKLPNGEDLPDGLPKLKLSKQAISETYGEEFLKKLPRPFVYSAEGGLHPDQAALIFGFNNGHELLAALESVRPKDEVISQLVNDRMVTEFGDMRLDGTIATEAMKAVHNDQRSELLKKEMEFLVSDRFATFKKIVRRITRPVPSVEDVKAQAKRQISKLAPRDIYPSVYQRSEAKYSREAVDAMLKGDLEKAFSTKLLERLNHELYRAAVDAKEDVDSMVRDFKRYEDDAVRNRIGKAGGQYLEQIDRLLERYDFRKSITLREIESRKSLLKWVNEQNALGFDVNVPDAVLDDARRVSYKDAPYAELVSLNETVQTIAHLANMKTDLLANKKHRDIEAAREDIVATIQANHKTDHSKVPIVRGLSDKVKEISADFVSSHTKIEFLFEFLDGMNPVGATFQNLWVPFLDAKAKKAGLMRGATVRLREIFGAYKKSERAQWYYKKIFIPEIGESLNKASILAVALNWGNDYNRDALMRGHKWSPQQVEAVLRHLNQKDWTTVQSIWDFIDSYWPHVKDLERKTTGRVPERVEAVPVQTQYGEFRGGYYPISFDSRQSWRQRVFSEAESVQDLFGGQWAKAMTRHGHTISRTNTGGKPLLLDLSVLTQHVENVIHDLSYREAVIDVSRIVDGDNVREAIQSAAGNKSIDEIQKWIRAIAGDRGRTHVSWIEGLLKRARNGATVVNLGLRFTSGISQSLGYLNTVREIGPKYAAKGLRDVFRYGANLQKTWDFIASKSSEMENRTTSFDRDVRDAMRKLSIAGTDNGALGVIDAYTLEARESFFTFIGFMDLATSVPTWLGAYQKALDGKVDGVEKADDAMAVLYADKVVRETQSAGDVMDLARIQTGNDLYKTFTMFYSQASLQFNQFLKTAREFQLDRDIPRLVSSAALIWFLPAVLEEIIRGRGPGDDEDPAQWIAENELYYPFQTMILLRDIVSGLQRSGYEPSPAYESINSLTKSAKVLRGLVIGEKEDITKSDVKNIANTVGYFAQLPTRQTWITLEYIYDWMTGEEEPENPIEGVWRSLVGKKR